MKIQYAIIQFCSLLPLIKIKGGKKKKLKHFYEVFIKYVQYMCISIYVKEKNGQKDKTHLEMVELVSRRWKSQTRRQYTRLTISVRKQLTILVSLILSCCDSVMLKEWLLYLSFKWSQWKCLFLDCVPVHVQVLVQGLTCGEKSGCY